MPLPETEVLEQKTEVTEPTQELKEVLEPVAKAEEAVPPEEEVEEVVYSEAELEELVQSRADSIAAKGMVTYQKTTEALKGEIAQLKASAQLEKEERELAVLEGREKDEWADLPAVGEFQKTRRDFNAWMAQVRTAYQTFQEKDMAEASEAIAADHALKLAIKYNLPDGEKIVKQLEDTIKEIREGTKTEAERELKALRASLKPKVEKKTAIKPDSGRLSAPGGRDRSKYTAKDWIEEGLTEAKK